MKRTRQDIYKLNILYQVMRQILEENGNKSHLTALNDFFDLIQEIEEIQEIENVEKKHKVERVWTPTFEVEKPKKIGLIRKFWRWIY